MGLPRIHKNMMLYNEGYAYMGEVASVTLPTLTRIMEDWRGGGMSGPVKIDMGQDAMTLEATFGGPMRDILRQYGVIDVAGVYLRFVGSYQSDDNTNPDTIEVIVRGRHEEIEMGEAKPGEMGEFKTSFACAYYKLIWNGRTEIVSDPLNMILEVGGVDRLAAQRRSLGLF